MASENIRKKLKMLWIKFRTLISMLWTKFKIIWTKFKTLTLWKNKACSSIFVIELIVLIILLLGILLNPFSELSDSNNFIIFLKNIFNVLNKELNVCVSGELEPKILMNRFWLYCYNIILILAFQIIFYVLRIRKIDKTDAKTVELNHNVFNFFGSKSYIAKSIDEYHSDNTVNELIYEEKISRIINIQNRIFKNKKYFIQGCFWLLTSFMFTYTTLLILSAYKISEDQEINMIMYRAIPLNTTVIEYEYSSKYIMDTVVKLQIHPSLINYVEDGVVYNFEDYAIIPNTLINEKEKIPLIRKNIKFKNSFLKSNKNIFIKEIDLKKIEFDKVYVRCLDNPNSLQKLGSFKMINLYKKYINTPAKIENCARTLLVNISSLFALILFTLLSYDTHSFKTKLTRQWKLTVAIFFFALLTVAEVCLAVLLHNNSYIVGNFICKSMSALVSVIVIAALAGRLIFLQEDTNNNAHREEIDNSQKSRNGKQLGHFFLFLLIYFYAVVQIFYPFEEPIIKSIEGFSFFNHLLLLSLVGKAALFFVLYIFTSNRKIEKFFIFEIDLIKSPSKNTGLEDFYYLMRYENKGESSMMLY